MFDTFPEHAAAHIDPRVVARHWRPTTTLPPAIFEPASPQQAPLLYRPVWHVGHLVYQGGVPYLKQSALNGGGFIPYANAPRGKEQPFWQPYVTPVSSMAGGGSMPSRPNFLTRLLGGNVTKGQ